MSVALALAGQQADRVPTVLTQTVPDCPYAELSGKITGSVLVSVMVDELGRPSEMKIVKGLDPSVDEEAIRTVAQWHFNSGIKDGAPAKMRTEVKVDFGRVVKPGLVSKTDPAYTEEAREKHTSGDVLLEVVVDVDGLARNIKVISPLGMGLDEKAIEAVEQWRFKPGTRDGVPVRVVARVEVRFRLCVAVPCTEGAKLKRQESARSILNAAIHEYKGDAVTPANPSLAFTTIQEAVAMEYGPAETRLGQFYVLGIGTGG